jgi:hypothetical protein
MMPQGSPMFPMGGMPPDLSRLAADPNFIQQVVLCVCYYDFLRFMWNFAARPCPIHSSSS